jgi:hypothetical protein
MTSPLSKREIQDRHRLRSHIRATSLRRNAAWQALKRWRREHRTK